jgi:glycosyltransferase involved in cell wall biosynthesis
MKVCIWKLGQNVGGTEISMIELARFLNTEFKDWTIDLYGQLNSNASPFASEFGLSILDYRTITSDYDILIMYTDSVNATAYAGVLNKIPIRIGVFGGYIHDLINPVANRAIVKSGDIKHWLMKHSSLTDVKVSQFPINLDYWKKTGEELKDVVVTYVGRTCASKNLFVLKELVRDLPCSLKMVLQRVEASERDMRKLAREATNIVTEVSVVKPEYESSSIFMMTSLEEGIPRSLMEAMAMSRPVVVYNVGGIGQLNPKYMFAPGTMTEIRNALAQLCASSDFRQEVGRINRKNIELYNSYVVEDLKGYFRSI